MRMAKTEEEKGAKRSIILKAALDVFAQKGYHNTTMTDVAEVSGIGRGTVYWYYKSKESLFFAVAEEKLKVVEEIFNSIAELNTLASDKIGEFFRAIIRFYTHEEKFCRVVLNIWGESTQTFQRNINNEIQGFYQRYRQIIKGILEQGIDEGDIREDIDTGQTASAILAMTGGIMIQWFLDPESIDKETIGDTMIKVVLEGIKGT